MLVWRHLLVGMLVSHLIENSVIQKKIKFNINLFEGFRVDLKLFLVLAVPNSNQHCLDVTK